MASRQGFAFRAWLGAKSSQSDPRTVLIEVTADGAIAVSRTGGDAWSVSGDEAGGGGGGGGGGSGPHLVRGLQLAAGRKRQHTVQTCNKWDAKGRNPAMNVYLDINAHRGSTQAGGAPSSGSGSGDGGSSSGGEDSDDGPARCKLGHLIQHCLPQSAERLGGYSHVALCWCTWNVDEAGQPLPGSIVALGNEDPAHWRLLRQLAKEKETGAGVRSASPPPPDEEVALGRAKETLLEAAAYFGPEAVAKCASLTVRKLYQREYHFFSPSGEDVADSRRHALEWAAGLAAVNDMLERCPEVRAKLSERLTGPSAGGGSKQRKRPRQQGAAGGSSRRRVVLAVGQGTTQLGAGEGTGVPGAPAPAPAAAAGAGAGVGAGAAPGLLSLPPINPGGCAAPRQLAMLPQPGAAALHSLQPLAVPPLLLMPPPLPPVPEQPDAGGGVIRPGDPVAHEQQAAQPVAAAEAAGSGPAASVGFTDWLRGQMAAEPSCSFGLSLLRPLRHSVGGSAAEVEQRAPGAAQRALSPASAAAAEQAQPASPELPPPSPVPRCPHCAHVQGAADAPAAAGPAAAPPAGEVVPLDAVLHAWQEHDAVRHELAQTQRQLAEVAQERDSLRAQLNAALAQLQAVRAARL